MDIASVIRAGRAKKGMSQRGLAQKMNLSPSAIAQWELGNTNPTIPNRVDLSQILSIPFSELLPEASSDGAEVKSQNRQTVILVQKFEKLPGPVRESILMQVVATADALEQVEKAQSVKK